MRTLVFAGALGVVLGLMGAPISDRVEDTAYAIADRIDPVVEARADILAKSPAEWRVVMWTIKHRDCALKEVAAYNTTPDGELVKLTYEREDGSPPVPMPPGKFRSAIYRLSPPPTGELSIQFLHLCQQRIVRTPVSIRHGS